MFKKWLEEVEDKEYQYTVSFKEPKKKRLRNVSLAFNAKDITPGPFNVTDPDLHASRMAQAHATKMSIPGQLYGVTRHNNG